MHPDPAPKRYVAQKRLRVGEGFIDVGEEFPAAEVTHALLAIGWVAEDVHGTLPPLEPAPRPPAPRPKRARPKRARSA